MPTMTMTRNPATTATHSAIELSEVLKRAASMIAHLDLDEPSWKEVGPLLTALVNHARQAAGSRAGRHGAPLVRADELVDPVLRVRDLADLQRRVQGARISVSAGDPAERLREDLRRLTIAAASRPEPRR